LNTLNLFIATNKATKFFFLNLKVTHLHFLPLQDMSNVRLTTLGLPKYLSDKLSNASIYNLKVSLRIILFSLVSIKIGNFISIGSDIQNTYGIDQSTKLATF